MSGINYKVGSIVFCCTMDSSVNMTGATVSYNVTKALEYTTDLSHNIFDGITFHHKSNTSPSDDDQITVTVDANLDVISDFNDTLKPSDETWIDLSETYITQAITIDLSSNNGVWNKSFVGSLDTMINAAFDVAVETHTLSDASGISYDGVASEDDWNHAHYLQVSSAFVDSSDAIYNGSGANTFGGLLNAHLLDISGTKEINSSAGFAMDIFRGYIQEIDTYDGTHDGVTLGTILTGNSVDLVLQIKGGMTGGFIDIENTGVDLSKTLGGQINEGGCIDPTSLVTISPEGTDTVSLKMNPVTYLLRYNFD